MNSKSVPLSDFDLLKAHHLRYYCDKDMKNAETRACRWNELMQEEKSDEAYRDKNALQRTVGQLVYRLRKWLCMRASEEGKERYVQREYRAAGTLDDKQIHNQTSEKIEIREAIQGGEFFFKYVDYFVGRYKAFIGLPFVKTLREKLSWGSNERYYDSMETLLFGYFLKFGTDGLVDAFFCISHLLALHRYNLDKVTIDGSSVRDFAKDSGFVLMIDHSPAPTYFLYEAKEYIQYGAKERIGVLSKKPEAAREIISSGMFLPETKGVKWGLYKALREVWKVWKECRGSLETETIRDKVAEEYGIR